MKHLIYIFSFLMVTTAFAQEEPQGNVPVDKMEETKTTKTTVQKNGKVVSENTVKETVKREQEIKTKQKPGNTPDGDKINTPVKVTKTIEIDREYDPFFHTADKTVYYVYNEQKYAFKPDGSGFAMTTLEEEADYGMARKTASNHFYLTTINGNPGVGYFDRSGNFVVEYYDESTKTMVIQSYQTSDF